MRVEISMNNDDSTMTSREGRMSTVSLHDPVPNSSSPSMIRLSPDTDYVSFIQEVKICVPKYWVIKKGLTAATGLGIASFIVVAFGGVITLIVNPGYNVCINTAASMITIGVILSVISAVCYTKVIGYCRCQELLVSQMARKLAMGEGGAPAMVALTHLDQPLEVMAPHKVIELARLRGEPYHNNSGLPLLQYSRGMTLKYGCSGRDGKSATVYLPDPDAPIDGYPFLKASVIASLCLFYVGVSLTTTFLITWVSAYPNDTHTMTVCVAMEVVGGLLSFIGLLVGVYIYTLCLKYEIEDAVDYRRNVAYSNPIMTLS